MKRYEKLARRKEAAGMAGGPQSLYSDEDDRLRGNLPTEPPSLRKAGVIVSPEDPIGQTVRTMSQMDMSREDKAGYLSKAGFMPQAISAILAQVDRYTESSED